ncbi:histone-lysine N-methyltransferase SETMAR [Trichonephila clavipes]|nr:histone-lysine N-methyltransferase SETMAR [Trichonephila clavipes]
MKIGNNGHLVLGPFDESTPCLMIVWMNCQTKLRINPLTAVKSVAILERFGWDVFGHPSYSPDLTPSDFHLFLHLKSFLAGKHFNNDKELKENVSNWLKTQAATFYEEGIEKLVSRYDTCLQNFGSYAERSGYSDDVQELLDSQNPELTNDDLTDIHEQEQDFEELESLDPVQSEDRKKTVGNLTEDL